MEVQIVLTTDNTLFARLARWLGAEWTHALLRYWYAYPDELKRWGIGEGHFIIIEAGFHHGVIERAWNPDEYSKWRAYRVKEHIRPSRWRYERILDYARGQIGKRYGFAELLLVIPRFVRRFLAWPYDWQRWPLFMVEGSIIGYPHHICSSLIDDCFLYAGIDLVPDAELPWVLPDDIRDSWALEEVESGNR